ncbi:hypothetical protein [Lysobacter sp. Hz 25]|uniref:hypothetical protein n=1 Tax=Lysobacter sp. Hz 25 TaxID=3383698 RepID=UPI0038D3708A
MATSLLASGAGEGAAWSFAAALHHGSSRTKADASINSRAGLASSVWRMVRPLVGLLWRECCVVGLL